MQVDAEIKRLGQYTPIRSVPVYGGQKIVAQLKFLKHHPEIIIGTPGRVIDLLDRRIINFDNIRFVVLDEVDRMLDIGFRDDIRNIFSRVKGVREKAERAASAPQRSQRHRRETAQRDDGPLDDVQRDTEYDRQRAEVKAAEAELLVEYTGTQGGDRPIDNGVAEPAQDGPAAESADSDAQRGLRPPGGSGRRGRGRFPRPPDDFRFGHHQRRDRKAGPAVHARAGRETDRAGCRREADG